MIQVYKILHNIDKADTENISNGTIYANKRAPSETVQIEKSSKYESPISSVECPANKSTSSTPPLETHSKVI